MNWLGRSKISQCRNNNSCPRRPNPSNSTWTPDNATVPQDWLCFPSLHYLQSTENIKWKIPEINNSEVLNWEPF
jgi:hypothetical protein